ncbi:restriction endonuclease family protein [Clostridium argentinense CDC 2741]|uniref:Restriction endonuclease family protein n=1 Tax=Clostridium argentinense CDC 2741 TaxID=1418104 RepID=A0A0C1U7J3_9CLOT|nr:restriction endonuclease [Clostridium argentinense]ARC86223.1 hypothetical protein RSJ17_17855 [Clostridium argentinense]KIE47773.1 restriction endonuclease family protein [Clostridium argentinense CDC 2741]NFF40262.1 restriction endonuclease [Clostridium argentinense]NFP50071.1 restriction endonuclease [Clostridium argentinense]NFP74616.1 restriction endonuclease [Clostridium argentinense]
MSIIKRILHEKSRIDRFDFEEFVKYTVDILANSSEFDKVNLVNEVNDIGIDIVAEKKEEILLIEVKKANLIGTEYIYQMNNIRNSKASEKYNRKLVKLVLLNSGDFTNEAKDIAEKLNIVLWDYKTLFEIREFNKKSSEVYKIIYERAQEEILVDRLKSISSGKKEWSNYQKCIADIFEFLFYPSLDTPRYEITDYDGANRRDIILENQSNSGFWKNIRELYKGEYIVVDAKNYSDFIGKKPVIEIAHYLKPYGCGMFGILACRKGIEDSAFYAMKEQWIGNGKLIICLDDEEIMEMLDIKRNNGIPEEIIKRKIADFRMKL